MWTQVSFVYSFLLFGVYCFVLPESSSALNQRMKFSSTKELRILASDISSNEDYKNAELRSLAGPLLVPRMPDTDSHSKVQQYIKNHFQNLNWNIEDDTFTDNTPYGTKQFNNIIVTYEPEVKNKLVLSCHYESKNMTDRKGNAFIAATDSAIPCTILLDIASKLDCSLRRKRENRKLPLSEDVTIQMIFFDGEEAYKEWTATDSLYGSRHLAKWLRDAEDPYYPGTKRLDNISLFVLLDLIGTSDVVFKNFFLKTDPHFTWLQKIEKSLKKAGLLNPNGLRVAGVQDKVLFSSARPWGGIEDDHKPFLHARPDLPVLHLISAPFPHVWHTMADNAAAINWDVTDNFNRIFRVFVANYLHLSAVVCRK
ncbi:glutaminyl-peptide cyclotransferase-like isoform X2 [Mercenaria mercenaria]|uniref:glutaminyl-peptide cyclotransferase-like isoform X2 n=1 Tax=Mercenaria mercenaria TaxID=6596 RepID=UPI00234F0AA3|nr:glutaminyl-peptide cyclotransferase-like isoform X2 [Mercenaria mercenaria]